MNLNLALLFPEWVGLGILLILMAKELTRPSVIASETKQSQRLPHPTGARNDTSLALTALIGAALLFASILPVAGREEAAFGGMFILDPFSTFFKALFALSLLVVISMSREFFRHRAEKSSEFILILWTSILGFFFLVSANDLLLLFIALEIVALSFYILAAYLKHDLISIEAGIKYLILGSLASAFLIFGIALLYVACGSTSLVAVREAYAAAPDNALILLGILLILSGLGFKIAAVPFQLWAPDVYEGAPTPVVAFLSVASKAAGFAVLLRLLLTVFIPFEAGRLLLFSVLAAMTLVYGSLGALHQTNIKRLMGYSSIGHAGYLLMGLAVGGKMGASALLYYLMVYAVANLAAFFAITLAERDLGNNEIDSYRGLAKRSPLLAGVLFISFLSLAGIPPLGGFLGKFLILLAAVRGGISWLALLGALGVVVSLYYYLNIVRMMYIEQTTNDDPITFSTSSKVLLLGLVAAILALGLWPAPFLEFARQATNSLF